MKRTTTRTPPCKCPYCEHIIDAASGAFEDAKPRPGDPSVCLYCAQELVFDEFLTLRRPLPGELETMYLLDPDLHAKARRTQVAVRAAIPRH